MSAVSSIARRTAPARRAARAARAIAASSPRAPATAKRISAASRVRVGARAASREDWRSPDRSCLDDPMGVGHYPRASAPTRLPRSSTTRFAMQDLADRALNAAQLAGAGYADVRVVESRSQLVEVKNRRPSALQESAGLGIGVRVLVDGGWGFAASASADVAEAERCAALACRIARASARFRLEPIVLSPLPPQRASYQTPVERDPFTVSLADKIDLLLRATRAMEVDPRIAVSQGSLRFWEEQKLFAASDGTRIDQRLVHSG